MKLLKVNIAALIWLIMCCQVSARNFTISGIIRASTGESLIGASVYEMSSGKGCVSNQFGFYSLTIPQSELNIFYSYTGFSTCNSKFLLSKDTTINISLHEAVELKEITVTAAQREFGVKGSQMSAVNVPVEFIKTVPMLFGESDIVKSMQLLPGVQSGTEGSSGFYVRGGGPDENLFLLDGVPVYNVNHIAGFFSVFNTDAVKNVTLYKGGFPARFGGRLSSVVDIRMNDGNTRKIRGNVSVGLITSKFNIEGPLFGNKTSFNISARRSYFDLLTKPVLHFIHFTDGLSIQAAYYFYDFNAKISHKISEKDQLFLSFYNGYDQIESELTDSWTYNNNNITESNKININWNWGNRVAIARWNRILTNKFFLNASLTHTGYNFYTLMGNELTKQIVDPDQINHQNFQLEYSSGITDYSAKLDFDFTPNTNHDLKFGTSYTNHLFSPGVVADNFDTDSTGAAINTQSVFDNRKIQANEFSFYLEDNWNINAFLKMNLGLHFTGFDVDKTLYPSLQPRLSLRVLLTDNLSLKAGYASMKQFIHLLAYNNFSLPNDLWVPATAKVKPMDSEQLSTGIFFNLKNKYDFSVEMYYKTMKNLIEYTDGASFFESSTGWEDKIVSGNGTAYGIELMIQKAIGKTTGWVAYTLSKAERKFDHPDRMLNGGNPFPAKYDRRHDVSFVVSQHFSEKFDVSGTIKYCSGNYVTLGMQNFKGFSDFDSRLPYYPARNNYQLPAYFRVDAGANFHKKLKHGVRTWNLSIYNVTNAMNPFYLFVKTHKYNDPLTSKVMTEKSFNKITIFPVIPSVSYSYKF